MQNTFASITFRNTSWCKVKRDILQRYSILPLLKMFTCSKRNVRKKRISIFKCSNIYTHFSTHMGVSSSSHRFGFESRLQLGIRYARKPSNCITKDRVFCPDARAYMNIDWRLLPTLRSIPTLKSISLDMTYTELVLLK